MTKEDLNSRFIFKRNERLKSKKLITSLFDKKEGSFFVSKPLGVAYIITVNNKYQDPQVGFTVSKAKFKLAITRNLIKRRIRHAYRINNTLFKAHFKTNNKSIALMFIYNNRTVENFNKIELNVKFILQKIIKIN